MSAPFPIRPLLAAPTPLGLVLGAIAFTAALTPSLVPRTGMLQGALAGLAFAAVYGIAASLVMLWSWLGLPDRRLRFSGYVAMLAATGIVLFGLANATDWQDAVHRVAGLPPVESARPMVIALVSLVVATAAIMAGRLFRLFTLVAANRMSRLLPPRVALTAGLAVTAALFWSVGNGVLVSTVLRAIDGSYQQVDALVPLEMEAPLDPLKTGSAASLLEWATLGAAGRNHVANAPDAAEIARVAQDDAMEPLRVYVGLNSADTAEQRAELALAELIRVGAFSRALLVIATPTGTGWIDPASIAPLEFLWRGDVASVSVQYSYLPSWLSLLVEPEYGQHTARIVFRRIYEHWRSLPEDARPRLYLHGLSLGSHNSELSAEVWDILPAPYHGAFWVGPPFANPLWSEFTRNRDPDTPAWAPRFRDGALVRFATQQGGALEGGQPWGSPRILYLQYPSDAVAFFDTQAAWRAPDWMTGPRAPDVAPELRWVPVVTFLQLLADVINATATPRGHGHVYAATDYIDGWLALTEPPGWDADGIERLRDWFTARGL